MPVASLEDRVAALERTVARLTSHESHADSSSQTHADRASRASGYVTTVKTAKGALKPALHNDITDEEEELIPDYTYMTTACERASQAPGPEVMDDDLIAYKGLGDFSYPMDFEGDEE